MQEKETVGESNSMPIEQITRVDYPVTLPINAAL
jgi:hypothetical protein